MCCLTDDGQGPDRMCTISGPPDKVQEATDMINDLVDTAMARDQVSLGWGGGGGVWYDKRAGRHSHGTRPGKSRVGWKIKSNVLNLYIFTIPWEWSIIHFLTTTSSASSRVYIRRSSVYPAVPHYLLIIFHFSKMTRVVVVEVEVAVMNAMEDQDQDRSVIAALVVDETASVESFKMRRITQYQPTNVVSS